MICACLVGFNACGIPTSPKHSWNVFLLPCNINFVGCCLATKVLYTNTSYGMGVGIGDHSSLEPGFPPLHGITLMLCVS